MDLNTDLFIDYLKSINNNINIIHNNIINSDKLNYDLSKYIKIQPFNENFIDCNGTIYNNQFTIIGFKSSNDIIYI